MNVPGQSRSRSPGAAIGALVKTLLYPVARYQRRQIWRVSLAAPREPSQWREGESLVIVGPSNFQAEVTEEVVTFVGNDHAALEGVRRGDSLCLVKDGAGLLACTYAFFAANTPETGRQSTILGVSPQTPIVGLSFTIPRARGRAIYRRALNDIFAHLHRQGCRECICEIEPGNKPSQAASRGAGMTLYQELADVIVLKRLVIQRVRPVDGRPSWRAFFV